MQIPKLASSFRWIARTLCNFKSVRCIMYLSNIHWSEYRMPVMTKIHFSKWISQIQFGLCCCCYALILFSYIFFLLHIVMCNAINILDKILMGMDKRILSTSQFVCVADAPNGNLYQWKLTECGMCHVGHWSVGSCSAWMSSGIVNNVMRCRYHIC